MTTHTAAQPEIVAAVQRLQDERNRALALLADVVESYTQTSRDDVVLVQIPADTMAEIRDLVAACVTTCRSCGTEVYAGTGCGLCALEEGTAR
jgi:PHP family Zn ribbon phosphoesterase